MSYKECVDCKQVLLADEKNFHVNVRRKDGSVILRTRCRKCFNAYKRKAKKNVSSVRKQKLHKNYIEHREERIQKSMNSYYKNKKEMELKILRDFVEEQEKRINAL